MARQTRVKRAEVRRQGFSAIHPNAAGIDVGSRIHVVAVAADRDREPVRTFETFTSDLYRCKRPASPGGSVSRAARSQAV